MEERLTVLLAELDYQRGEVFAPFLRSLRETNSFTQRTQRYIDAKRSKG